MRQLIVEFLDTILLGRKTYELFVDFWPTATTDKEIIADRLNTGFELRVAASLDRLQAAKSSQPSER